MSNPVQPGSMDEKIGAIAILVVLVIVGVWMFTHHDMGFLTQDLMDTSGTRGSRSDRKINSWSKIIDLLWSRPVAVVLVVCGLAMIPTILRKKPAA